MSTLGVSTSASIVLRWTFVYRYEKVWGACWFHSQGESMLMAMKDVALSSGSAWWDWTCVSTWWFWTRCWKCRYYSSTSASLEPSYVLRALGAEEDMAHSSIRSYIWKPLSPLTNISSSLFMHWKILHDPCVRFGIGRFTSEEEVVFSMSCQHKTSRNIPRWDTLLRGLWRKCLDWETCLLSGIWSRCAFLPSRFQYLTLFLQDGIDLKTIQWTQH